jgi:Carboxypeptidase regulatory-like domain/TonB dependent receptor-like, beta-barrel
MRNRLASASGLGALLLALAWASSAAAQVGAANIGGTVTDESGGALPGVTITVTNRSNGVVQTFVTGERGNYRVVALQPAPYEIRAEISGFAPITKQIVLTVGTDATIDFKLGVAALQETINVVGEVPLVEVNKSQPSSVVTGQQIENLPTLSRNFQVLAQLLPGTKPAGQSGTGSLTGTVTNFGGIADPRNGFTTLIDGGAVDDAIWGSPVINFGQDAIQEFKVFRNQFDAQYGAALAAVVTVVTKSGGNRPTGSVFYFGRDKALNAIDPAARSLARLPPFNQIRGGGSFGGPIVKNKTHFFTAIEHLKITSASITNSAASNPFKSILDGVFPTYTRSDDVDGRVDHRINDAHSMYLRYAFDDQIYAGAQKPLVQVDGMMLGGTTTSDTNRAHSLVFEENWIQSPTRVNTLRVHYLRHQVATVPTSTTLAVVKTNGSFGQARIAPQFFPRTEVTFNDTWYWTTTRHNVKVGGDFRIGRYNFEAHFNEHGRFTFNTDAPFDANNSATWPFSFAMQKPGDRPYRSTEIAGYAQDDWRVADRVRLNLGLRYDVNTNLRFNDFFEPLRDDPKFKGIENLISADRGNDYSAIQPRVGATWDVRGNGSLVARGGVGLYVTRNRPWFQMTAEDMVIGNSVLITDPQAMRFYPDINAVLGGKDLDAYIASGAARALYLIDNDLKLPRQATISGGVAWQINEKTSVEGDIVHGYGWDQLGSQDVNLPASGRIAATNPRPVAQFTQVGMLQNFSESWYDALEVQVRRRVGRGSSLQASYTWSRALLDGVTFYSTYRGTQRTPQSYGYNSTDRPHNIVVSAYQSFPYDIQFSIIARYLSGVPIAASSGVDLDGDAITSGDRPTGIPQYVGRGPCPGSSGRAPACIDVATQLSLMNAYRATLGLAPATLDMLTLNSTKGVDVRLNKMVNLGAGRRLQLYLEGFNVLNSVNWNNGSGNIRSATFLVATPGGTARQIQWGGRFSF